MFERQNLKLSYVARYNALDLDMSCSLQQYEGVIQAEDRRNSQKSITIFLSIPIYSPISISITTSIYI